MSLRVIHEPNSGEAQLEDAIYKTFAEYSEHNADRLIIFTGTKIRFPCDALPTDAPPKLLVKFQRYKANINVLNNKTYLEMDRPKARSLWQQGAFKIYMGLSLSLSLYYLTHHLEPVALLAYFAPTP